MLSPCFLKTYIRTIGPRFAFFYFSACVRRLAFQRTLFFQPFHRGYYFFVWQVCARVFFPSRFAPALLLRRFVIFPWIFALACCVADNFSVYRGSRVCVYLYFGFPTVPSMRSRPPAVDDKNCFAIFDVWFAYTALHVLRRCGRCTIDQYYT